MSHPTVSWACSGKQSPNKIKNYDTCKNRLGIHQCSSLKIYTAHFYDFSTNFLLDSWLVCGSLPLVKALKNDLMHFFSSMKDEAIGNSNLSLCWKFTHFQFSFCHKNNIFFFKYLNFLRQKLPLCKMRPFE